MKLAHILLVHKNPLQIVRLIKKLKHPDVDCWIHIDKKFDTKTFREKLAGENVFFVKPNIKVDWGCFNTVEAMLSGLKCVVSAKQHYDYINFLSGQDYPLQLPAIFIDYLHKNNGLEFLGIQSLEASPQNAMRIYNYYFNGYFFPGKKIFQKIINNILPERKFPYPFEIRKGPQWITVTSNAAAYILDFVSKNPRYINYFKKVDVADEFFFQTILYNSDFKENIQDGVFHYTDWSEYKRNPKMLTINDKEKILESHYFFARKFDTLVDTTILDLIDREKLSES